MDATTHAKNAEKNAQGNLLEGKTIAVIGAGNLGTTIAKRLVESGMVGANQVIACGRNTQKLSALDGTGIRLADAAGAAKQADIVLLCVKPRQEDLEALFKELGGTCAGKLVISVMAGISNAYLAQNLKGSRVIRTMPNLLAAEGRSETGIAASNAATENDRRQAMQILGCLGNCTHIGEQQMAAWTGLSSLPGFFSEIVVAGLSQAFEEEGFGHEKANSLVISVLESTLAHLRQSGESPHAFALRVASKGGTTEASIKKAQGLALQESLKTSIAAAMGRAKELEK